MFNIKTQLSFFRFNTTINLDPINVNWFILESENDSEESVRCFTQDEKNKFLNFIALNELNFPGNKNYHNCMEDDCPDCSIYTLIPSQHVNFPLNLIIRQTPQLSPPGQIYDCMDIILTNFNHVDNHSYNLDFNVIGQIENN